MSTLGSMSIDASKFDFKKLSPEHKTIKFDCTDKNGKDSEGLQKFWEKYAVNCQNADLGTTYVVFYSDKPVGYITVATSSVHKNNILKKKRPVTFDGPILPAVIITNFAIDKPLRNVGLGKYVLWWCIGLGRKTIAAKIGCRYIVLYARNAINFYHKNNFRISEMKEDGKKYVMMYADLFQDQKN